MSLRMPAISLHFCPAAASEIVVETGGEGKDITLWMFFVYFETKNCTGIFSLIVTIDYSICNLQASIPSRPGWGLYGENGSCPYEAEVQAGLHSPIALSLRNTAQPIRCRARPGQTQRGFILRSILLPEGRY